jgi:plastocyanin
MVGRIARIGMVVGMIVALSPIAPAAAGGGGGGKGACFDDTSNRSTTSIDAKGGCFFPTIARVAVGSTVTWTGWDADMVHTVTGANNKWGTLTEAKLAQGKTFSLRFTRAGVYPYYCMLHPGMAGVVLVGDAKDALAPGDLSGGSNAVDNAPNSLTAVGKRQAATNSAGLGVWLAAPIALVVALGGFGLGRRMRSRAA